MNAAFTTLCMSIMNVSYKIIIIYYIISNENKDSCIFSCIPSKQSFSGKYTKACVYNKNKKRFAKPAI